MVCEGRGRIQHAPNSILLSLKTYQLPCFFKLSLNTSNYPMVGIDWKYLVFLRAWNIWQVHVMFLKIGILDFMMQYMFCIKLTYLIGRKNIYILSEWKKSNVFLIVFTINSGNIFVVYSLCIELMYWTISLTTKSS